MSTLLAKQNFPAKCEALLVGQINMELHAGYTYFSMYSYCTQDNVALLGLARFFEESYKESDWSSGLNMLERALELERAVNTSLLEIGSAADEQGDMHLAELIQSDFLAEQVDSIKKLSGMITRLKLAGSDGLGLYLFDQSLLLNKSG